MRFGELDNVNFEKDLLTLKELAYIFGKSYRTVVRWKRKGMPFTAGLITINEAREWLKARSVTKCR
jgi:phage terminase Nu1 subunit (DNA packaging protein)